MIGEKIKQVRDSEQMTQEQFSKRLGISRNYLSELENNKRSPSVNTLEKIAKAMNKELYITFM